MAEILEIVIQKITEGIKEGIKNYSAQIVSAMLLGVTMLLFPSLRNFVGKSLREIIDKIFHKPQPPQNNEAKPLDEILEEDHLPEVEDIEIPKWFKKRRRKEKRANITKDGVIAFFLLCLGLFMYIFSLWMSFKYDVLVGTLVILIVSAFFGWADGSISDFMFFSSLYAFFFGRVLILAGNAFVWCAIYTRTRNVNAHINAAERGNACGNACLDMSSTKP